VGLLIIAMLALMGCAKTGGEGKVPITSMSDEATREYLKGRALAEKLLLQSSINYFDAAVSLDPTFAMAHLNRAFASPTAKEFFEHLHHAVSLVDKVSEGERLTILAADAGAYGRSGQQKEFLDKLIAAYPNDERVHFAMGNHYNGQQAYIDAIAHYRKAIEISPDYSPGYNSLGYAYRATENYVEAENAFKKYTELIPNDPNPADSYAELLLRMGRFDESIAYYKKALSVDPKFPASHIGIACNLMYQGKADESRGRLQMLYDNARDDGERRGALFGIAILYVDRGEMDFAMDEFDRQYKLGEKINDVAAIVGDLTSMGLLAEERGKLDEAQTLYERGLKLSEESNLSQSLKDNVKLFHHYNMAGLALRKKDLKTANAEAAEVRTAAMASKNANQIRLVHELVGRITLEEKRYDDAIVALQQANQQDMYNLYRLSLAYMGNGDTATARHFCEKAARTYNLPNLNYALIRMRAEKMLATM
ncbi:MAG: tetratricopeptide repeat protein, partial [Ignavibacteriae bacterium]|nr:tetratricopeptide repeat protein [Ignavibacteriota bacterium]